MDWTNVIENPLLQNLPFKIELNKWGQILMTPASNNHGALQFQIAKRIDAAIGCGRIIMECSIDTPEGVKVADVAWASDDFIARHGTTTPYPAAPEICVEITSPSNSAGEIAEKIQLYLDQGATEVWIVDEKGSASYFTVDGKVPFSGLVSE